MRVYVIILSDVLEADIYVNLICDFLTILLLETDKISPIYRYTFFISFYTTVLFIIGMSKQIFVGYRCRWNSRKSHHSSVLFTVSRLTHAPSRSQQSSFFIDFLINRIQTLVILARFQIVSPHNLMFFSCLMIWTRTYHFNILFVLCFC